MILWRRQSQYQEYGRDERYWMRSNHGWRYAMRRSAGGAGGMGVRHLSVMEKQFAACIVAELPQTVDGD